MRDGFVKVKAAAPEIKIADTEHNAGKIIEIIEQADSEGVKVLTLPELCTTGASCRELYYQKHLLHASDKALQKIVSATQGRDMLVFVGAPLAHEGKLYSAAAAVYDGKILAFVPKESASADGVFDAAPEFEQQIYSERFSWVSLLPRAIFTHKAVSGLNVAPVFSADRQSVTGPLCELCANGALILAELSDEPMRICSKNKTSASLRVDSEKHSAAILSAAPGEGESTTDHVYSGLSFIYEAGEMLSCGEFGASATSEIDIDYLIDRRRRMKTFKSTESFDDRRIEWGTLDLGECRLTREYRKFPFVPEKEELEEFCERAMLIQAMGVKKRMEYTGLCKPVIGVSGGVDSTLVMLSCAKALDMMGLPRENLIAITMPCFGTTARTKSNAVIIAEQLGATLRVIPIDESVKTHFKIIDHSLYDYSVVFENAQARERTMVLLNVANKVGGINVGTKDLSEQIDGWCTFNGDQISNYDINAGLTKTMVQAIVRHYAAKTSDKVLSEALLDILDTPVTPELLPISEQGELLQKSEDSVGPYSLQDFFLYHMIIRGTEPKKLIRISEYVFKGEYDRKTLVKWLIIYSRRLFVQQFKRSTTADGPDQMGFTFSPRTGFKMPSDAENTLWLKALEEIKL